MLSLSLIPSLFLCLCILGGNVRAAAFVPSSGVSRTTLSTSFVTTTTTRKSQTTSQLEAFHPNIILDASVSMDHHPVSHLAASALTSSHVLLSTIDSDIAAIPENEFTTIFAGGILVMFGGLLSAIIVGLILESKDLYASVVADSYVQGGDDEEFWKGLSEEEKKKAQELLSKMKGQKNDGESDESAVVEAPTAAAPVAAVSSATISNERKESKKTESKETVPEKADMFSDY